MELVHRMECLQNQSKNSTALGPASRSLSAHRSVASKSRNERRGVCKLLRGMAVGCAAIAVVHSIEPDAVEAQSRSMRPVPKEQWTPQARLWLARAMVAEAGFLNRTDHVALAWVLAKRWKRLRERRDPSLPFVKVVRAYCAGLGDTAARSRRQQWVRELPGDAQTRPKSWPSKYSWKRHRKLWRRVLERADAWARGELADPCPQAVHWGGTMDKPRGRMRAVCARLPTANDLYSVGDS